MPRSPTRLDNPDTLVVLLILGQVVMWTLVPALTHTAPPLDVAEGYMWGREWVLATYKHPALPSWALEASRLITGAVGWPAYLISQLCVGATFLAVYLLGRDIMGPARAAAGTLLLTGIAFYAWPTPEFNHNVCEMPFWAGCALALWRAVERHSITWWLLLGALAAGGLYAKLTTAILLTAMGAWILWDARARASLATIAPWMGLALFALLAAPLAHWLLVHSVGPLQYAAMRTQSFGHTLPRFVLSMAVNIAGALVMLAIAGLIGPRRKEPAAAPSIDIAPRAVHYLVFLTAGPLALAAVSSLLGGASLKSAWGSSMFNLAGLLAIALSAHRFDARSLQRLATSAGIVLLALPLGYGAVVLLGPRRDAMPMRVTWPQAEMSQRLADVWTRETGRPLRIVGGDNWVAGLVGVSASGTPSIFTSADPTYAPWITPERLAREGMLIVWDERSRQIPAALQPMLATSKSGVERFRTRPAGPGRELAIGYAIVPPR